MVAKASTSALSEAFSSTCASMSRSLPERVAANASIFSANDSMSSLEACSLMLFSLRASLRNAALLSASSRRLGDPLVTRG